MVVLPVEKKIDWRRPPIVLIALVAINILMFAFYQSGDEAITQKAIDIYAENKLAEIEYPAYENFQNERSPDERINKDDPYLYYYMVFDDEFRAYVEQNQEQIIKLNDRKHWQSSMSQIDGLVDSISYKALGLSSENISLMNVLSHQFLHGDFWHLFGNMVFLLLTGFAVEAAIGHARFLIYYLLSGIGAGLLYIAIQNFSHGTAVSLVGASGAISGVMAMYLALFKFRKIEFFYWLFIFTGYFRAAAIIILPTYILKELYFMMFTSGSNVAYSAHIGGFITGAALIVATQVMAKQQIDTNYLDGIEEEELDPYRIALNELYKSIAHCDFKKSWFKLKVLKEQYPDKPELDDIQFNLLTALDKTKANAFLLSKLQNKAITLQQANALMDHWQKMTDVEKETLSAAQLSGFLQHSLTADKPGIAETIFMELHKSDINAQELAILARKISVYYDAQESERLATKYRDSARAIMQTAQSGV